MVNVIVLWNTLYINAALEQLQNVQCNPTKLERCHTFEMLPTGAPGCYLC